MPITDQRVDLDSVPSHELPAVVILAAGGTMEAAAQAIKSTRQRIARKCREPAWMEAIRCIRNAHVDRAAGLLSESAADAVARLGLICNDGEAERDQLNAAKAILDFLLKYRDHSDFAERLLVLEAGAKMTAEKLAARPDASEGTDA